MLGRAIDSSAVTRRFVTTRLSRTTFLKMLSAVLTVIHCLLSKTIQA